jgi:hypothetical protein
MERQPLIKPQELTCLKRRNKVSRQGPNFRHLQSRNAACDKGRPDRYPTMLTAQQPPANRLNHLHPDTDAETALLIAQLLEEDLTLLESTRVAESFQIRQAINDSVLSDGIYLDSPMEDDVDSEQNALRMMAQSAREEADWEMAKILQSRNDKDTIAGQQFAMKMAAEHVRSFIHRHL